MIFSELERRYGFAAPTAPASIDHLLVRGLEIVAAPAPGPRAPRGVEGGLAIRLSDHAPVQADVSHARRATSAPEE